MLYGVCLLPDNWIADVVRLEGGGGKAVKKLEAGEKERERGG